MKVKQLRLLSLCAMVLMVASALFACSPSPASAPQTDAPASAEKTEAPSTEEATQAPASTTDWGIDTSPVELTMLLNRPENPDGEFSGFWGKNGITKMITKETGVTPVVTYSPDDTGQRLNMLIASNDLPDIVIAATLTQIKDMVENDLIHDLDELSKTAAPNFMSLVPSNVLLSERLTLDTMKYYVVSNGYARPEEIEARNLPQSAWGPTIVKEIYEELGSPVVKTGDDYINLIKQAQAKYPDMILHSVRYAGTDGFGNPRVLEIVKCLAGVTNYFEQDGQIKMFYDDPDFVKAIQFVNKLYSEKVLWPDEFVADEQVRRANLDGGKVLAELSEDYDNLVFFSSKLNASNSAFSNFIMLDMFQVIPGKDPVVAANTYSGSIDAGSVISKKSEKADRAIRFLEYMYLVPEVQRDIVFGTEGVTYDLVDGQPVLREEFKQPYIDDPIGTRQQNGIHYVYVFRNAEWQPSFYEQVFGSPDFAKDALNKANEYAVDLSRFNGIDQYATDSEEIKIYANIKEYYSGKIVEILTGPADSVESSYQALLTELHGMGLDQLNAYQTEAYKSRQTKIEQYKP